MKVTEIFNALAARDLSPEQKAAFAPELMRSRGIEYVDGLWVRRLNPLNEDMRDDDFARGKKVAGIQLRDIVPLDQVQGIFDALSSDPDMGFQYSDDGCHVRTHLLCAKLFDMGVVPQKSWAFSTIYRGEGTIYPRFEKGMPEGALYYS